MQATAYGLWPSLGLGFKGGLAGSQGETCFHSFSFYSLFCAVPSLRVLSASFFYFLVSSFSPLTLFLPTFPKFKTVRLVMKTNASSFSPKNQIRSLKEGGSCCLISYYSMMFGCLDYTYLENILDITSR